MRKVSVLGLLAVICSSFVACTDESKSPDLKPVLVQPDPVVQNINGKTPEEFYSQFFIGVRGCEARDSLKWMQKSMAVTDSGDSSLIPLEGPYSAAIDIYLEKSQFKSVITVSRPDKLIPEAREVVGHIDWQGIPTAENGRILLGDPTEGFGILSSGALFDSNDTMVLEIGPSLKDGVDADKFKIVKSLVGKKLMVVKGEELLTGDKAKIACDQTAAAAVF